MYYVNFYNLLNNPPKDCEILLRGLPKHRHNSPYSAEYGLKLKKQTRLP